MRFFRIAAPLTLAVVASVVMAAALPQTILAGDAIAYRERMAEFFSGKIPYVDFPFEHLPLMLLPMSLTWLLGGWASLPSFAVALAAVSTLCLLGTGWFLLRSEEPLGVEGLAVRWLLLTVPLMPFLLFRNDSFVVLLTVGGIWLTMTGRPRLSAVVLAGGVLAKAWPVVWVVSEWWRKRIVPATVLVLAFALAVSITMSPAVQAIQDPQGLHTETLAGSALGLSRSLMGAELQISSTATAYIAAPGWARVLNLGIGGLLVLWALRGLRLPFSWAGAWLLTGALIGAGLIAAPYFSTQYVYWLVPFVAFDRRLTRWMLIISVSSLLLISTWHQLFEGAVWWWGLLVGRNMLLIGVVVLTTLTLPIQPHPGSADEVVWVEGDQ